MGGADNVERLRTTFNSAVDRYNRARPQYPEALFDQLVTTTGLKPGDRLVEVGCAAGTATRPLAERGFDVTCVELGSDLAASAKRNLSCFPNVRVINQPFESWRPPSGDTFALVFAATSWHWVNPAVRYRRAFDVLRPGGHLAFWSATHVFPEGGDQFFRELQEVYDEIGEGLPADADWYKPGELPDSRGEIEATGLFNVVSVKHFDWEVVYDAEAYIDLLETFSGHIAMEAWQRARLYGEICARLAKRDPQTLRRHWGAVLHVARRR